MKSPGIAYKPRILVAPLDWGLGHTTRCIPIIYGLIKEGCQVLMAGDPKAKRLFSREFPTLPFLDLKGYEIHYSKSGLALPLFLTLQIPKILSIIKYENELLDQLVKEHKLDAVISDNRYGLYHSTLPTVIITHQLKIKSGFGNHADQFLQKLHFRFINRFSECWIPDTVNKPGLAGELSHTNLLPQLPINYIGPVSRFERRNEASGNYLLIVLSGPEPQRTALEDMLLIQLQEYKDPVILVRGLPEGKDRTDLPSNISQFNHLDRKDLEQKMLEARFIISRCGYSTVMDLSVLKKKAILIPTPGQTEQEYLANHLMSINFALCIKQSKFRLLQALDLANNFPYKFPDTNSTSGLIPVIQKFILKLKY